MKKYILFLTLMLPIFFVSSATGQQALTSDNSAPIGTWSIAPATSGYITISWDFSDSGGSHLYLVDLNFNTWVGSTHYAGTYSKWPLSNGMDHWNSSISVPAHLLSDSTKWSIEVYDGNQNRFYDSKTISFKNDQMFVSSESNSLTAVEFPELPHNLELNLQNYPNPFNPTTTIEFDILESGNLNLIVYNSVGQIQQVIESGYQSVGKYKKVVDASSWQSGIYYIHLNINQKKLTKKITLIK